MKAEEKDNSLKWNGWYVMTSIYGLFLVFLNFVRIFDNNFWGDEAYSIRLAKLSFQEMLQETAMDVHPPLYYIFTQIAYMLFGDAGVVYHAVSFVPYLITMILAITVIAKRFGLQTSVLLMTLCSVLETSVNYNVEVRMYSWGSFFMLLAFLALYDILYENNVKSYVLFAVAGLAGAYTHYYCLVSVAFLYAVLLVWSIVKRKEYLKKTIIVCVITIVLYLPWFVVLLSTFKRTAGDFWMTDIPYIKDCFLFLFEGKASLIMFVAMLAATAVAIYRRREPGIIVWYIAGFCSVFGTMLVGNLVSRLVRPVFIVRYLYPVAILAWIMLAVGIASAKKKNIYLAIIVVLVLATGLPAYAEVYKREREQNELLRITLTECEQMNDANSVILTDSKQIDWTIAEYYFPEAECVLVAEEVFLLPEQDKIYWIIDEYGIAEKLDEKYQLECIVEQGSIGTNYVTIYRIESTQ